jgi:DNA-binding NarL/FixJ family response regulator
VVGAEGAAMESRAIWTGVYRGQSGIEGAVRVCVEADQGGPLHILLVEDNPGDAHLLRLQVAEVSPVPHAIHHVSTLHQATAMLEAMAFDVVLLDLHLPDGSGVEAFRAVALRAGAAAVVALTGLDDPELALALMREGADDYLVKGETSPANVLRALSHAVARRRLQDSRASQLRLEAALLVSRTIAHEINNALSPVVGYADLLALRPGVASDAQASEFLARMRQGADEAARKVEQLQRLVRLETSVGARPGEGVLDLDRSTTPPGIL